jgi:hypothetical protein
MTDKGYDFSTPFLKLGIYSVLSFICHADNEAGLQRKSGGIQIKF